MGTTFSIIVLTYNSSKYVLETLESIKAQTFRDIELIISDDGSTDNTIQMCREWINTNKALFKRTELLSVNENSGIPSNCNRGLNASNGEWLKFIAGDDLLDNSCILNNIKFISDHPESKVIISKYQIFYTELQNSDKKNIRPPEDLFSFFDLDAHQQLKIMRFRGEHLILGMVISSKTLRSVNGFDEKYRLFEDLPLLLRLLEDGNKFYFLPEVTAYYRREINAVSNPNTKIYKLLQKEMLDTYLRLRRPYLSLTERIHTDLYFLNDFFLIYFFKGNIRNFFYTFVSRILLQLSPIQHRLRRDKKKKRTADSLR